MLRQLVDVLRPILVLHNLDLVDVVELPARVELLDLPLDALVAGLLNLPEDLHVAVHCQCFGRLREWKKRWMSWHRHRLLSRYSGGKEGVRTSKD